jgi:hypothetical protein
MLKYTTFKINSHSKRYHEGVTGFAFLLEKKFISLHQCHTKKAFIPEFCDVDSKLHGNCITLLAFSLILEFIVCLYI